MNAIDLFCGAGGMALGFEQAGVRVLAAVDASEVSVLTYRCNFPHTEVIMENVAGLTARKLKLSTSLIDRPIDVVFGGPPCQGFSVGGKRAPGDPRNQLVLEFGRLVVGLGPKYFVMENVAGYLRPEYTAIRQRFERVVRDGGYGLVRPICVLNAAEFGVPQRRMRAFVLGYRESEAPPVYPTPKKRRVSVAEAIDDLRCIEGSALLLGDVYTGALGQPSAYARRLRAAAKMRARTVLTGCVRTKHSDETLRRFGLVVPGRAERVSRFIRLTGAGLAPTLRAGTGRENGRFMAPRPIHPEFDRCITVREAARLHSYPDDFVFHEAKWHGIMQIGNSVPPLLARAVATEIVRAAKRSVGGGTPKR